ncbi:flavin reductase family protein [Nocardia zapadnayensis]|uniref:flavin reductase family protein n=1 Tax=Nocardia rhamnosiphila TaxID=426716 RepID=UPI002245B7CE|nr:flavin reductase family protein [Nocardia zapadnayensis]MCX0271845.1 flavin reductase family protein [Nocardia zapadnayensis]
MSDEEPRAFIDIEPAHWDRMYAPSSALAVVTTVDTVGNVNAAALGACVRIAHDPVAIMFTVGIGRDTANNVLATGEFVVNIPSFEPDELRALCLTGTDLPPGHSELDYAGLTAVDGRVVKPPRIAEYSRHFECAVLWNTQWRDRLTVVGEVVAASCSPDVIDDDGELRWEVARPATYCGGPYGLTFTPSYERATVTLGSDLDDDLLSSLRPTPTMYGGLMADHTGSGRRVRIGETGRG